MKLLITTLVLSSVLICFSCSNNEQGKSNEMETEHSETAMYYCPMKCEGEKKYEEKGICPVCKMDLELVSHDHNHEHHHDH